MKLTNATIFEAVKAMSKPGFNFATGKTGYAIYRSLDKLKKEAQYYEKVLNDTIKKHGERGEDGNYSINVSNKEAYKKFLDDITPVANMVVDVDLYQIDKESFEMPYCEEATKQDYMLIEALLVKEEVIADENDESEKDQA